MKILEKILVATDLSKATDQLLETASFVAKAFHSEIHLVHVIPDVEDSPLALEMVKDATGKQLERIRAEIAGAGIKVADPVVEIGTPFARILEQAELHNVNTILMGPGSKPARDKIQLGITAERVMRRGGKPVWLVKPNSPVIVQKVVCPVDFSESSKRALRNAVHLSRRFKAELSVLNVTPPLKDFFLGLRKVPPQQQQEYARQQQERFARFLKGFDFHNVNWHEVTLSGKPEREILRYTRETGCNLLVMGTVGKTGAPQVQMGKVAEKVIREMPCSVIAVKQEDPIRLRLEGEMAKLEHSFQQAKDLLEHGFPEEAVRQLQQCIEQDRLFAPAWEALASAYKRLGREQEAQEATKQAKDARKNLWERQVMAEIRSQLPLWSSGR